MSLYGYDAAYPPPPATIKAAGGVLMAVYLTAKYAVPTSRCAQIRATGLGVLLNYEEGAAELVTAGRSGGQAAARRALAAAIADGAPASNTLGIYFSVDVNVSPGQFAAVGAAFDGINDVLRGKFLVHVYGEGALIDYLIATGRVVGRQWLSASTSFPGFNADSPNVGLVQLVGTNVPGTDQNTITNAAGLDAWWPAGSPYGDDDMPLSPDESEKLTEIHTWLQRLSFGFDDLTGTPFSKRAEITERLRDIDSNTVPLSQTVAAVWNQPLALGKTTQTAAQLVGQAVTAANGAQAAAKAIPAPAATVTLDAAGVASVAASVAEKLPQVNTAAITAAVNEAFNALVATTTLGKAA